MSDDSFKPLEHIGLCFSGGGYRATFFSLGVLSYLNHIKLNDKSLLDRVVAISTVSGGTLTGVAYANAVAKDETFDILYKNMYQTFDPKNDNLLERALDKLMDDNVWKETTKKRTLINSFALAYRDMKIFDGSFNDLEQLNSKNLSICFNATEFSYGLAFRFQNGGDFGNYPLSNKHLNKIAGQVHLADAVASSSCFPMGFEPLIFPDDFFEDHSDELYKTLKALPDYINGIGVMDGGIVDNQGIGSMVLINKRTKSSLDTIIINDVGSYMMKPWEQDSTPVDKGKTLKQKIAGMLKFLRFNWFYPFLILAGVVLVLIEPSTYNKFFVPEGVKIFGGFLIGIGSLLSTVGIISILIKKLGITWLRGIFNKEIPRVLQDDVERFQNLDFNLMKRMLDERITSSMKMIQEVFLKQIRRLNYDLLYNSDQFNNKRITATVYELNGKENIYRKKDSSGEIPAPSVALQGVALTASETPTTLWWDDQDKKKDRMDTLIATGQFTTCYNLLDYLLKLEKTDNLEFDAQTIEDLNTLKESLLKDWNTFNERPLWLV